ncbi:olfactory receptor 1F12-like [Clupea harengus]|uniref:Olfactory receptor n=1 Tax=Clupea harengus TaxID=7950 RepID=A0A6P3VQU3_CLUHA|nr:olfactory receptor 1F12-like [Clupea harengus]
MNHSFDITLIFTAYQSIGPQKYVYFTIISALYIASVFANMFLMLVIIWESRLHQPMFIFLFNLTCIGLFGSTAVWPKVLQNLLSDTQTSSYEGCLCQVFIVSVYATGTYSILTVMAYDRYVSIINPLRYHTIMTPQKVKQLLAVSNLVPIFSVSGQVCLTSRVPLCRRSIHKFYCENISVSKLSCVTNSLYRASSLYGVCVFVLSVVFIAFFVLLSYIRIITVSLKASADSQKKAISTCAPHLIVFINFSMSSLFSIIYNQFVFVSEDMHMFLSVQFVLVPPLLHPIIYGIKNTEIRKYLIRNTRAVLS